MTSRYPQATLALLVGLALAACSTSTTGSTGSSGRVDVTAITTGEDIDPDGYTVTVDADERSITVNGSVSFTGLEAGIYAVTLGDVAENCQVANGTTRTAPVTVGPPVEIDYVVTCEALPE